jgi:hypothetical protein
VRPPELAPPLGYDATGLGVDGAIVVDVEPETVVDEAEPLGVEPRPATSPFAVEVEVWVVGELEPVDVPVVPGFVVAPSTPVGGVVPAVPEVPGGEVTVVPAGGVLPVLGIVSIDEGGMSASAGFRVGGV